MTQFIHIRNASSYSLARGAMMVDGLVKLANQHQLPALGLMDFDNFCGALEFSLLCKDEGIQPIIGINCAIQFEGFSARIGLIAQNNQGFLHLSHLISNAYRQVESGYSPIINLDNLFESEGIICISGGMEGLLNQRIKDGKDKDAKQLAEKLGQKFANRFYIELQRHGDAMENFCEGFLLDIAHSCGFPILATNDCHFSTPHFAKAQEILMAIGAGTTLDDNDRPRLTPEHYFKSPADMLETFSDLPEAIEQTIALSKRCSNLVQKRAPILPSYTKLNGRREDEALRDEAQFGLENRFREQKIEGADKQDIYKQRLDYELSVINKMGFDGYFLIVYDFINYAKRNNIPVGPGRGSGAGSLVAYSLRITDLDPMRYGLLFERFLNPERVSMPDFDIDFCQDERDKVIDYVQKEYGDNRVAQIITFGSLQAKAAVRDVGRVLGFPYPVVDGLSKLIPNKLFDGKPKPLGYWLENDDKLAEKYREDSAAKAIIDNAKLLEGLYRNASTHAAGVVISGQDLADLVPIYWDGKSPLPATQYSMKYVESAGLVKFDFLGLRTLSIIKKTLEYIKNNLGVTIDINLIPLDDSATFDDLKKGYGIGVFQFESDGIRKVLRDMRTDRLEDLIAAVALYRPGPMDNIPTYIRRKHGEEKLEYDHPALEPVLAETYGIPVYQEQVMEMAKVLAGFSLGGADLLRRAMGKKIKSEMDAMRDKFVQGCAEFNQIPADLAIKIFENIEKFAGYGFNKSHAAAYGFISYQTAYLKAHYPHEFMAAFLSYEMHNTDKVAIYKQEAERMGLKILPLDINHAYSLFVVEYDENKKPLGIRYALSAIKGVGSGATDAIIQERNQNGPYKNIWDFLRRNSVQEEGTASKINKKILENFVRSGVFDIFNPNRRQLYDNISMLLRYSSEYGAETAQNQENLFADTPDKDFEPTMAEIDPYNEEDLLKNEFEALGLYLSRHPLSSYNDMLSSHNAVKSDNFAAHIGKTIKTAGIISEIREMRTKKGKKFMIISFTDEMGRFEATAFDEVINSKIARDLKVGAKLFISLVVDRRADSGGDNGEESLRLTMLNGELLENISLKQAKGYKITIQDSKFLQQTAKALSQCSAGNCPIHLVYKTQNRTITIDSAIKIRPDQQFLQILSNHSLVQEIL